MNLGIPLYVTSRKLQVTSHIKDRGEREDRPPLAGLGRWKKWANIRWVKMLWFPDLQTGDLLEVLLIVGVNRGKALIQTPIAHYGIRKLDVLCLAGDEGLSEYLFQGGTSARACSGSLPQALGWPFC